MTQKLFKNLKTEYKLLKELLKYSNDDILFYNKIVFRLKDCEEEIIKRKPTLEQIEMINEAFRLICKEEIKQREIWNEEIKQKSLGVIKN